MADERSTDLGAAGASASRRADRIRAQRQRRAAGRSRLGRLLAIVLQPEQDKRLLGEERRWRSGAQGEQILAASLARRCPHVPMLHDRHAPPSRGNIDHIAIAGSGIYVIDTKRYRGKIEVVKTLFGQPRLRIAGRDRTKLLLGLERQVAEVQAGVADLGEDVAVSGCLCFGTERFPRRQRSSSLPNTPRQRLPPLLPETPGTASEQTWAALRGASPTAPRRPGQEAAARVAELSLSLLGMHDMCR